MLDLKECESSSISNFWDEVGRYDDNLQCLAEDIYCRFFSCDTESIEDDPYGLIYQCLDEALIYDCDQWKVLKAYCSPTEASWEEAIGQFTNDIINALDISIEDGYEE